MLSKEELDYLEVKAGWSPTDQEIVLRLIAEVRRLQEEVRRLSQASARRLDLLGYLQSGR